MGAKRTWGAASRQTLKHPRIALQLLQVVEVVHVAVSQVPLGLMDKASDFESEDCGFESHSKKHVAGSNG